MLKFLDTKRNTTPNYGPDAFTAENTVELIQLDPIVITITRHPALASSNNFGDGDLLYSPCTIGVTSRAIIEIPAR